VPLYFLHRGGLGKLVNSCSDAFCEFYCQNMVRAWPISGTGKFYSMVCTHFQNQWGRHSISHSAVINFYVPLITRMSFSSIYRNLLLLKIYYNFVSGQLFVIPLNFFSESGTIKNLKYHNQLIIYYTQLLQLYIKIIID
jgi:hypothetical protein